MNRLVLIVAVTLISLKAYSGKPYSYDADTTAFAHVVLTNNFPSLSDNGTIKKVFLVARSGLFGNKKLIIEDPIGSAKDGFKYAGMGNTHLLNKRLKNARFFYFNGIKLLQPLERSDFDWSALSKKEARLLQYAYVKNLMHLSLFYQYTGRNILAKRYNDKAYDFSQKFLPGTRAWYAVMHNRAILLKTSGAYVEAADLLDQVMEQAPLTTRVDSINRALVMNNRSLVLFELGQQEMATELLNTALSLGEKHFLPNSLDHEKLRTNKALFLQGQGHLNEALALMDTNLTAIANKLGRRTPEYGNSLVIQAGILAEMNQHIKAQFKLDRAAEQMKRIYGPDHLLYGSCLSKMATLFNKMEYPRQAAYLLERVGDIEQRHLGEQNLQFISTQMRLAYCYWKTKDHERSLRLFRRAIGSYVVLVNDQFPSMNDYEREKLWEQLRPDLLQFYGFVLDRHEEQPELLSGMYWLHMQTKGLLLSETNRLRTKILESDDTSLLAEYTDWIAERERLAGYYSLTAKEVKGMGLNLDSLNQHLREVERDLVTKSGIDFHRVIDSINIKDIQASLAPEEAAVEIIRLETPWEVDSVYVGYLALVVTADRKDPQFILLSSGNSLETKWLTYYKNCILYNVADQYSLTQYWKPLSKALDGKKRIFMSLDGVYNKINLNTLRNPDGSFLVDDYELVYVSKTKSIPQFKTGYQNLTSAQNSASLFGYPDFGGTGQIQPLPGTLKEINKLEEVLLAQNHAIEKHLKEAACESAVKRVVKPELLHIATHGFFLRDTNVLADKSLHTGLEKALENPLLRSGLYFCNAGEEVERLRSRGKALDEDNGILTAFEVMNMNLLGTDLVVLSACETGLGEVRNGEGVYGLQRAFFVAGAKCVVQSLWKVDDTAAQELMVDFYSRWLSSGDRQASFLEAQRQLKTKYQDPKYWGAFVMVSN